MNIREYIKTLQYKYRLQKYKETLIRMKYNLRMLKK